MHCGRDEFSYLLWWYVSGSDHNPVAAFFLINLSTEIGSEDQNGVHAVSSSFWKTILEWFMKFAL